MTQFSWFIFSFHPHPIPIPLPLAIPIPCIGSTIYLLISSEGTLWDIGHHHHHPCCCYYTTHGCITYSPSSSLFFFASQTTLEISSRLAFLLVFVYPQLYFFSSWCHSSFHVCLLFLFFVVVLGVNARVVSYWNRVMVAIWRGNMGCGLRLS